jgi:hypothetical protein
MWLRHVRILTNNKVEFPGMCFIHYLQAIHNGIINSDNCQSKKLATLKNMSLK